MKHLTTPLNDIPWVRHGFFTRQGGASDGIYGSLNCGPGSSDDPAHVVENRARIVRALDVAPDCVLTPRQVHSDKVFYIDRPVSYADMPQVDALVTDKPGLAVGILTADCAPVLFASASKKIVGAAHAGWKGALNGVLESTIAEMEKRGADRNDIVAALGPCIGPQSYEVSDDFKAPFLVQDAGNGAFFRPASKPGHLIFDLPAYVRARLEKAGVHVLHDVRQDTFSDEGSYFSYRRSCHRKEADYGRQMSIISIRSDAG